MATVSVLRRTGRRRASCSSSRKADTAGSCRQRRCERGAAPGSPTDAAGQCNSQAVITTALNKRPMGAAVANARAFTGRGPEGKKERRRWAAIQTGCCEDHLGARLTTASWGNQGRSGRHSWLCRRNQLASPLPRSFSPPAAGATETLKPATPSKWRFEAAQQTGVAMRPGDFTGAKKSARRLPVGVGRSPGCADLAMGLDAAKNLRFAEQ